MGTESTCTRYEFRCAANGVVVKVEIVDDGTTVSTDEFVYQIPRSEDSEIDAFADFLRDIAEQFGPSTSRYSPKRIYVRVEPGDKYEGGGDE